MVKTQYQHYADAALNTKKSINQSANARSINLLPSILSEWQDAFAVFGGFNYFAEKKSTVLAV